MQKLRYFCRQMRYIQVNGNFFLLVGLSSILVVTLLLAPSKAQIASSIEVGWEFLGTSELNKVSIKETQFEGQCPGISSGSQEARFTSSKTPPATKRRVVVKNITRGLDSNPYPYTDRDYSRGMSSEGTQMAFGTRHRGKYLSVIEGENEFEYEITENKKVVDSGNFTAVINKLVDARRRDAFPTTEYRCLHYDKHNQCTNTVIETKYTCANY